MNGRRRIGFRLAAVLLGLVPFLLVELLCRWLGWGAVAEDAFAEFESVRPLFVLQEADRNAATEPAGRNSKQEARWTIAENRLGFFAPESFAAEKSENEKRIFILGGSTVQGRPYSIETSFGTFLEIAVAKVAPQFQWEAVHCGGLSYASYRLLPILNECLQHQPDLIVICSGHNEFLESVTYADVLQSSEMTRTSYRFGDRLHTVRAVRNLVTPAADRNQTSDRPLLPTEARALLDFDGGYELFTRANLHRKAVVSQFGDNLNRMVAMCRQADVPVMLILPPANLRDCPPFKSEFGEGVSPSQQQRIRELLAVAGETKTAPADRIGALQQAVQLDSAFAFSWYRLGQEFLAAGRIEEAAAALQRACDEDVCPLRMTTALREQMDAVRTKSDLPTIDAHRLLAQLARDGIPGNRVLVDHVHPSFTGHQQIAIELLKLISDVWSLSDVRPQLQDATTAAELEQTFADHLQSLDDLYFLRGQRTLEDLRAWAEGRADGPPVPDRLRSRSASAVHE